MPVHPGEDVWIGDKQRDGQADDISRTVVVDMEAGRLVRSRWSSVSKQGYLYAGQKESEFQTETDHVIMDIFSSLRQSFIHVFSIMLFPSLY